MIWQCFITLVGSCKAILYIPGELLSKFTVRKAIHMEMVCAIQTSKCISLSIMHYGKSILRS